jgi:hypothetical protein
VHSRVNELSSTLHVIDVHLMACLGPAILCLVKAPLNLSLQCERIGEPAPR